MHNLPGCLCWHYDQRMPFCVFKETGMESGGDHGLAWPWIHKVGPYMVGACNF